MDKVTLNTGHQCPILGFGVYQVPVEDTEEVVSEAIQVGYRLFDTAQYYGNESGVGAAIAKSGIPREEFFITTKVSTSGYDETSQQIDRALENLQTDVIDLVLIHWVVDDYQETYRALVDAYKAGKIRSIGLSNFNKTLIEELLQNFDLVPAVLQNEMHVLRQQKELRAYCQSVGIQFESWAPLGQGKKKILKHPDLQKIADKHGKTVPQVILRFLSQSGVVTIPKTVHKNRMIENFASQEFDLTAGDLATIENLDNEKGLFGWN